jgi:hypothetical protein
MGYSLQKRKGRDVFSVRPIWSETSVKGSDMRILVAFLANV